MISGYFLTSKIKKIKYRGKGSKHSFLQWRQKDGIASSDNVTSSVVWG
jgi:hypothetical protein